MFSLNIDCKCVKFQIVSILPYTEMAQFVLGENDILEHVLTQSADISDMEEAPGLKEEDKRHYKKDSR